jgi:hypothetical protein
MQADESAASRVPGKGLTDTAPGASRTSGRGHLVAAVCAIAILATYAWLATYGTGNFLGEETWGSAFDSLAKSLVEGRADVEPDTIDWEGFQEHGKIFISFGPLPALLRVVPNAIVPSMQGKWSRASCFLGAWLALLGATLAFSASLRVSGSLPRSAARVYLVAGVLGFGLGSPLTYLVSCSRIYHEAIVWGLCGSLWAIYFMIRIVTGSISRLKGFLGLSVSFGVAVLARVTFGVPIALALAVLLLRETLADARSQPSGARKLAGVPGLLLALTPALVAGAGLLWYNYTRFGSIWKSFDFHATYVHPDEIGGVLNLARAPSAFLNYFGLTSASFLPTPPFFRLAPVRYLDDSIFFGWKEQTLSLTLGSSWLIVGAVLGAVALVRRWRPWETLVALAFLPEVAVIATFYFVTQRYAADFLPLLVFLFSLFLIETARRGRPGVPFAWVLVALAVASSALTLGSTLEWNLSGNRDAPAEYKTRLARLLALEGHVPDCPGPHRALTDSPPVAQSFSYAAARFNRTWDDNPILFGHRLYVTGIGMHADSRISYRVPQGAIALCVVAGLPDSSESCRGGSVVFEVRDDADRLLTSTGVVRSGEPAVPIRADVRGVKEVSLVVLDAGDGIDCDHGTWGDPVFLLAPASPRGAGASPDAARR